MTPLLFRITRSSVDTLPSRLDSCDRYKGLKRQGCKEDQPRSQGPCLYFEKVPWLRLVTCLCMPTEAAQRVGPQLNFVNIL